eukprot:PhF_6_TR10356/c0_g1_i1/m.16026
MVNSCLQRVICQKNLEGKKGVSFSCTTVFQILLSSNSIRDTFTHSVFSDDADGSPHFLPLDIIEDLHVFGEYVDGTVTHLPGDFSHDIHSEVCEEIFSLNGHTDRVTSACFLSDNKLFLCVVFNEISLHSFLKDFFDIKSE